ncbi:MAG: hypothetical protein ACD_79C01329G0002 [uncultured bacterium]|nr:MAG: hypothetical protein ACD_79C01329G0002 [uncultured bacterium]
MEKNTFIELIKEHKFWERKLPSVKENGCKCQDCLDILKILKNKKLNELTKKDFISFGTGFLVLLSSELFIYMLPRLLLQCSEDNEGYLLSDVIFYLGTNDATNRVKELNNQDLNLIASFIKYISKNKKDIIHNFDYTDYLNSAKETFIKYDLENPE